MIIIIIVILILSIQYAVLANKQMSIIIAGVIVRETVVLNVFWETFFEWFGFVQPVRSLRVLLDSVGCSRLAISS